MILEACVGNLNDALIAEFKGAHQIELCTSLDLDGNSPSLELVKEVTEALDIAVKVILNPKPFDYHYTKEELDDIIDYIKSLDQFDVKGFVFGPVDKDGFPDLDALKYIADSISLPLTYHKAIDSSPDIFKSVKMLIDQDLVSFILTSGGAKTAEIGSIVLGKMQKQIKKSKSSIKMIGAGRITDQNLAQLHQDLNLDYYHGKLIVGNL